jgi:hypothetical protein
MSDVLLKFVGLNDIPQWLKLSHEYDVYIIELVGSLLQWYDGNENNIAFLDYMNSKIAKKEAIIAVGRANTECQGIIAFSRNNNRITFFGVSHKAHFEFVSKLLIDYALSHLDMNKQISVNIIKSDAEMLFKVREIFSDYGFIYSNSEFENGVPVDKFNKSVN